MTGVTDELGALRPEVVPVPPWFHVPVLPQMDSPNERNEEMTTTTARQGRRTRVREVLLVDGWHTVAANSFELLDVGEGTLYAGFWGRPATEYGFTFVEFPADSGCLAGRITGPLTSILAVREDLPRSERKPA